MNSKTYTQPARDCDAISELIPDYAFGLTDIEQTRMVETNLDSCPEAAAQLADFRRIQDEMRESIPQIEPPAFLSDKLMAAIAEPEPIVKAPRKLPLGWIAAAAAVILLIATNVYWLARVNSLSAETEPDRSVPVLSTQDDNAFVLTSTSNLRWVRLPSSQQENTDTSAFLMWNRESEIGLLYVRGFDQLTEGKTYQLWLTHRGDEERYNAGTFTVDESGVGALLFNIPVSLDDYRYARITEEPTEGSDEPTGIVVVHGEM